MTNLEGERWASLPAARTSMPAPVPFKQWERPAGELCTRRGGIVHWTRDERGPRWARILRRVAIVIGWLVLLAAMLLDDVPSPGGF